MKKLFLRAEFGPLWEPWEEDEIGRKAILNLIKEKKKLLPKIDHKLIFFDLYHERAILVKNIHLRLMWPI